MEINFDPPSWQFSGAQGSLALREDDLVSRRLAMLLAGECQGFTASQAAALLDLSRPRYYQLREAFLTQGALGLLPESRGPKSDYRRTDPAIRLVIRQRFLDPDAPPEVIAQVLRQNGHEIAKRSVQRIIADYGLQKKTLRA